mmetsp:Transcript_28580/g.88622  ORF Transcript_28580/g.88622 Transcript_28580/m.88622 type:complete len:250 (+) Transcript_28580:369-1118(+)
MRAPVPCCSLWIVSPPFPINSPTQPSGTAMGVGGPKIASSGDEPIMPACCIAWSLMICSTSTRASRTQPSCGPQIVSVRFVGSALSASGGMRIDAPVRSWIPRTVVPPLPMMRPTRSFPTWTSSWTAPVTPRFLISSAMSFLARSIASGLPVNAMRRASVFPGCVGSASRATCTRTPNSFASRFTFSPPLPITNPTMELGTRASYVVSPCRGADGTTRHESPGLSANAVEKSPPPPSMSSICARLTSWR